MALSAAVGVVADEDDDANAAVEQNRAPQSQAPIYNNGPKTAAPNGKEGKSTAADWAKGATEKVNLFKTAKELKDWLEKNQATIDKLADFDAKAANILSDLINDRLDAMNVLVAG
jgi:hypothetical protein